MATTTEEIARAAGNAVAMCQSRSGNALDYTEGSLAIVEETLAEAAGFVAEMTADQVTILAWEKVRGRLGGDEGDNIPFFYAGFADRARRADPGADVLYV